MSKNRDYYNSITKIRTAFAGKKPKVAQSYYKIAIANMDDKEDQDKLTREYERLLEDYYNDMEKLDKKYDDLLHPYRMKLGMTESNTLTNEYVKKAHAALKDNKKAVASSYLKLALAAEEEDTAAGTDNLLPEEELGGSQFINLTPHAINVKTKTGKTEIFEPSGKVARVDSNLQTVDQVDVGDDNIIIYERTYGSIIDLPNPQPNTYYIVSAKVLDATKRKDVLAPATDSAERNDKGHIISVPGFVRPQ